MVPTRTTWRCARKRWNPATPSRSSSAPMINASIRSRFATLPMIAGIVQMNWAVTTIMSARIWPEAVRFQRIFAVSGTVELFYRLRTQLHESDRWRLHLRLFHRFHHFQRQQKGVSGCGWMYHRTASLFANMHELERNVCVLVQGGFPSVWSIVRSLQVPNFSFLCWFHLKVHFRTGQKSVIFKSLLKLRMWILNPMIMISRVTGFVI